MRFQENIRSVVTVEAGDAMPTREDFMEDPWDSVVMDTDIGKLTSVQLGVYPVEFHWGPITKSVTLFIRDSVPPKGEAKDVIRKVGEEVTVDDFVVSAEDVTPVNKYFYSDPDMTEEGTRTVRVVLEDAGGNQTILTPKLSVYDPKKKPEIRGMLDQMVYVGETISYRNGVTVTADQDTNPQLEIDSASVDLDHAGVYPVTYTATDKFGRVSRETVRITVADLPDNYYDMLEADRLADETLAALISPTMDEIDKAFAIFRWVRKSIPWNNTRTPRDEVEESLAGLKGESGDCFTHAVTCKRLLEHAGFEVLFLHRDPGPGQHYWLMVRIGKSWYHMDPSPVYMHQQVNFLATDEELDLFSYTVRPNYYIHNYTDYPATPLVSPAKVVYKKGDYYMTRTEQN